MRSLKVGLLAIMLLLMTAGALPASAAETTLPLAPITSVRQRFVATFNGHPLIVGQFEYESANRSHGVLRWLERVKLPERGIDQQAGDVIEVVTYDGTLYLRMNAETTWLAVPDDRYHPAWALNDQLFLHNGHGDPTDHKTVLTKLDAVDIDGTATTHYQYWFRDGAVNDANGGQATYDLFVAADGRVLKDQFNARGAHSIGTGELSDIATYYDFNAPIKVGPPPADQVQKS
jgi:hypothetical protein